MVCLFQLPLSSLSLSLSPLLLYLHIPLSCLAALGVPHPNLPQAARGTVLQSLWAAADAGWVGGGWLSLRSRVCVPSLLPQPGADAGWVGGRLAQPAVSGLCLASPRGVEDRMRSEFHPRPGLWSASLPLFPHLAGHALDSVSTTNCSASSATGPPTPAVLVWTSWTFEKACVTSNLPAFFGLLFVFVLSSTCYVCGAEEILRAWTPSQTGCQQS